MPISPMGEDYASWASRRADAEGYETQTAHLAAMSPMTAPVEPPAPPPTMSAVLRRIADALELMEAGEQTAEDAVGMLEELPGDLRPLLAMLLGIGVVESGDESEDDEDGDGSEATE